MEPKLFTKAKNANAEEIKQFLPVNRTFRFETFSPALALVEQNYIIPTLGKELFDKLVAFYENDGFTGDADKYAELLRLVQFSEVRLAYWKGYNSMSVMITDAGASSQTEQSKRL